MNIPTHDRPSPTAHESRAAQSSTPTYWDYVKVESLLSLQGGLDGDESGLTDDEVMFIVVHQIDELWFKVALRELSTARDLLAAPAVEERALVGVVKAVRRATVVLRHLANHFELMETLSTRDYLAFRDKLAPASGYQSGQLRELEILMGLADDERVACAHGASYLRALRAPDGSESPSLRRVHARLRSAPTLEAALTQWIARTPIDGSPAGAPGDGAAVAAFVERYLASYAGGLRASAAPLLARASEVDLARIEARLARDLESAGAFLRADDVATAERPRAARARAALVFLQTDADATAFAWAREVLDSVVAFEQAFVVFRQRHARMVERIIGRRSGTSGTAGVEYLDETALRYRVFKDIAAARTILVRDVLPLSTPVSNADDERVGERR